MRGKLRRWWPVLKGVLTLAILFAIGRVFWRDLQAPEGEATGVSRFTAVLLSLLLLAGVGLPLLPPAFNRLVHHLSLPFRDRDAEGPPRIRLAYLAEGLLLTGCGWLLLGASLAAALHGVAGDGSASDPATLGRLAAVMGLSYVCGFVILVAPGGLGVREFFLIL